MSRIATPARLVVLAVLTLSTARAQTPDSLGAPPSFRADLAVAGVVGGLVAGLAVDQALAAVGVNDGVRTPLFLVSYPLGASAGVYGAGRSLGIDGTYGRATRGALKGALLGYGAGAVVAAVLSVGADDLNDVGASLAVGALVAMAGPPLGAARAYRVAPVTVRTPTGLTSGIVVTIGI